MKVWFPMPDANACKVLCAMESAPTTIKDVSTSLGMSPTVVGLCVKNLCAAGLLTSASAPSAAPKAGKRPTYYHASDVGLSWLTFLRGLPFPFKGCV